MLNLFLSLLISIETKSNLIYCVDEETNTSFTYIKNNINNSDEWLVTIKTTNDEFLFLTKEEFERYQCKYYDK